jgi:hypothetical protein
MMLSGMEDINPHYPTGYTCTICGGVAVVDADGTYLCAADAISAMSDDLEVECIEPADAGPPRAALVDLTDVGEVRSTRARRHRIGPVRSHH